MRRGFILGGRSVILHDNGAIGLYWTLGIGTHWSEDAERAYEELRHLSEEAAAGLYFDGKRKVVLDEGVALAVAADDPRPGWDLGSKASIDLLLAQEIRKRTSV